MAKNKYAGEIPLKIGSKQGTLVFDWRALGALHTNFSKDALEKIMERTPEELAQILAIGFQKLSPDITVDIIFDASPAIEEVAMAIDKALLYAYHGTEKAEQIIAYMDKARAAVDESTFGKTPKKKPAQKK